MTAIVIDGIYVGIIASEDDLALYPFGTELGWAYLNRTNYMLSSIAISLLIGLLMLVVLKIMNKCSIYCGELFLGRLLHDKKNIKELPNKR